MEENNAIFFKKIIRDQVSNSEILHREVDATVANDPRLSSHGFLECNSGMVLEEWKLEHFCHVKQMAGGFRGLRGFYDPVAEYMDKLGNSNVCLYIYCKDQFLYYNLVPPNILVLFFI